MIRALILAAIAIATAVPAHAECTNFMRREASMFPGFKRLAQPEALPPIAYIRPDGGVGQLDDLRGRPSLITFWFPRCVGCQQEGPSLNAMLDQEKPQGAINFLALSVQGEQTEVVRYLARKGYANMDANVDPGAALFRELCLMATPVHAVLNADAELIALLIGPQDWTSEKSASFLQTLAVTGGV